MFKRIQKTEIQETPYGRMEGSDYVIRPCLVNLVIDENGGREATLQEVQNGEHNAVLFFTPGLQFYSRRSENASSWLGLVADQGSDAARRPSTWVVGYWTLLAQVQVLGRCRNDVFTGRAGEAATVYNGRLSFGIYNPLNGGGAGDIATEIARQFLPNLIGCAPQGTPIKCELDGLDGIIAEVQAIGRNVPGLELLKGFNLSLGHKAAAGPSRLFLVQNGQEVQTSARTKKTGTGARIKKASEEDILADLETSLGEVAF